ncbi:MAG: hypothetical protein QOI41_5677 [Myxococcales bacterium]|nr:hypothetical protein [Myxococcales bacterium]
MRDGDQAPNDADPARSSQPPRASQPPHAPRPWKGAWRVVFAFVWVTTQIALVITADRRPDAAFGFRMFSESSTLKLALYREVIGDDGQPARIHVDDGVWSARDGAGASHRHAWNERVRRQELATFDIEMNAKYGVDAQLARLQAALDDLATHVPEDAETRRFMLDVTVRKNAREPYVVHLASAERARRTSGGP